MKWQILWRALRWRLGSASMLFVVAALAIAAAAIGPMFLQSADDSVLSGVLKAAPGGAANLTFSTQGWSGAQARVAGASRAAIKVAGRGLLEKPLLTSDLGVMLSEKVPKSTKPQPFDADLIDRTGICQHVRFVAGHCPTGGFEIALSERSAALLHRYVGQTIPVEAPHQSNALVFQNGSPAHVRTPSASQNADIVGIYLQPPSVDTAYWAGGDYFPYGSGAASGPPLLDALIASTSTIYRYAGASAPITFSASIPWRDAGVLGQRGSIDHVTSEIDSKLFHQYSLQVSSALPAELSTGRRDDNKMSPVILSIDLQVVLLALLVLYALGRSSASARRIEADFARRRGFPRSALLSIAVSEPIALVTAALPVGVLIAWLALRGVGGAFFAKGSSLALTWPSVAAGVGGYVAAILAATLASYSLWRRSVNQSTRRASIAAIAFDTAGVALAFSGLIAIATSGALNGTRSNPLASIAPGLLALGAAIIGLRVFGAVFSLAVRATRGSRRIAWFLAFRQVARRPEMLRRLLPLTVAVGVVLFAIGGYALAAENRSAAAAFETGADRVVDVIPPLGANFVSDVRRADPSGRQAMAAVFSSAPSGNLLAVDSSRLAAVAAWPKRLTRSSIRKIARELSPPTHAPITFAGSALRMRIDVSPHTPTLDVFVSTYDPKYEDLETFTVTVHSGVRDYVIPLKGGCPSACRLVSVNPVFPSADITSTRETRFTIEQLAVRDPGHWRPLHFGAGVPGSWREQSSGFSIDSSSPTGVRFTIPEISLSAGGVLAVPADLPSLIPAVVTNELASINPPSPPNNAVAYEDLDGTSINLRDVAQAPALPNVGQNAALIDLTLAERAVTQQALYTTDEVWLTRNANPTILERLRRDGYKIGVSQDAAVRAASIGTSGIGLAYDLALVVTPIAALLAVGGVVFSTTVDGRRRRSEIASLADTGIKRSSIGRSLVLENVLILAVALVIGGAIGFGADQLALPALPQFISGSAGFPVLIAIPVGTLFAALGALACVLALGAIVTSRMMLAAAFGSRAKRR